MIAHFESQIGNVSLITLCKCIWQLTIYYYFLLLRGGRTRLRRWGLGSRPHWRWAEREEVLWSLSIKHTHRCHVRLPLLRQHLEVMAPFHGNNLMTWKLSLFFFLRNFGIIHPLICISLKVGINIAELLPSCYSGHTAYGAALLHKEQYVCCCCCSLPLW